MLGTQIAGFDAWLREHGGPALPSGRDYMYESPFLNMYLFPEATDYRRATPLPPTWHRLDSSVRTDAPFDVEAALPGDAPIVYLSLGSLGSADVELMQRLIDVLGKTDYRVIVSKGPQHELLTLADNMFGEEFLPQPSILPQVDVVITHGGNNTVTECFHFGKPMIVLPLFWDQYDNAQRVDELNYGTRLDTYRFEDEQLTGAIASLLADEGLKPRHLAVSQQLQASPGNVRAADLIERLADDRRARHVVASRIARHTRSGESGRSMWRTPRCESASITALWTAGVEPIAADSPIPLAPSGFSGVGVSVCAISNGGSSEAAGIPYVASVPLMGLPRLVVDELLVQRLRDALPESAVHLPVHEHRVQDAAAVVDRDVTDRPHVAGLRVDLHDRHVRAERERRLQLAEASRPPPARASCPSGSRDGSFAAAASSPHVIARSGAPATSNRPFTGSVRSASSTSSRCDASARAFATTACPCSTTADPPTCSEREPHVPAPRGTTALSECTTRTDVERHPEDPGRDLRHRRLVALPLRRHAGEHGHRAVTVHLDRAELLRRERRDLDVRAHPDAQQQVVAASAPRRLLRAELRHARDPQRLVERALVVPDVVGGARRGRVRERVGRDQVLPADVDGVHAELGRDQVHRALDERGRLRTAGSAVRRRPASCS